MTMSMRIDERYRTGFPPDASLERARAAPDSGLQLLLPVQPLAQYRMRLAGRIEEIHVARMFQFEQAYFVARRKRSLDIAPGHLDRNGIVEPAVDNELANIEGQHLDR